VMAMNSTQLLGRRGKGGEMATPSRKDCLISPTAGQMTPEGSPRDRHV
jgi:hypothetical protein